MQLELDLSSASGELDLSSASCASALGGLDSVGVPGAVLPCWSFEPLIGFPLEPVCNCRAFCVSPLISPLEPDCALGEGTTFRGALAGFDLSSASGGFDLNSASCCAWVNSILVGVPGAVAPCCSFEPLIGFPLEPVCGAELFPPHSPISPLEPDIGGSGVLRQPGR